MVERGELFLKKISLSRNKVAKLCHTFIKDGAKILTHSSSRVVLRVLEEAAAEKKRFTVYVTEPQPDSAGYIMEKVDLVIVGAEGVVESGVVINKVGPAAQAVGRIPQQPLAKRG
ncbi:translation initiation factor eIF2B subunit alpha-like isoform X4 [Anguilla rostrata]|uniref:translation initiation factor eIF2B subunit alpha-like isoform X4 n=1 Tax=Anguilla rostrata TaxID=7938 RepID=UPI0030D45A0D